MNFYKYKKKFFESTESLLMYLNNVLQKVLPDLTIWTREKVLYELDGNPFRDNYTKTVSAWFR